MSSGRSPLSEDVLALLRCPLTRQPLQPASEDELARRPGDWAEGGFVTEDGSYAYPIRNGFPVLLPEEAVALGE